MPIINENTAKSFLSEIYQLGVGNRIKNLMEKQGIDVKGLAKWTGIPIATLYRIISGKNKNTRLNTIRKLCEFFEVTPNELIRGVSGLYSFLDNHSRKISDTLRYLMNEAGISQNELARQINISQQAINKILQAKTKQLSPETLDKLTHFFKVSEGQLRGELPLPISQIKESNHMLLNRKIPFVLWRNLYLLPDSLHSEDFIISPYCGSGVYATRILQNPPFLKSGDVLIVDYETDFRDGVTSLIQLVDRIAIGNVFCIDDKYTLVPLDSHEPTIELKEGQYRKLGVVLHVIKSNP